MEKMCFSDLLSKKFNWLLEYKDGESIPSYDRNSILIKNIIFILDNIVIKTHKKIEDQKDPSQDYTISKKLIPLGFYPPLHQQINLFP